MPQSLTINNPSSLGSAKRQRSADSREIHARPASAGRKWSGKLTANVRVPAYLDKTKNEIASTFQDLEWKQRFRLFHALENPHSSPFRVDRSDVVISRNRYGNVQPWDQSRIKLKAPIGGSDYVNASPIVLKRSTQARVNHSGETPETAFNESRYIATQGPKTGHFSHFWFMVHQETTGENGVIIMLTQCYEANKEKCALYFPTSLENPTMTLTTDDPTHDDLSIEDDLIAAFSAEGAVQTSSEQPDLGAVTLISCSHDESIGCDVRVFEVTINDVTKTIHHYLFNGWPDFGRPEAEERVALLQLTRKSAAIAQESPRIVHCSAGVGRTGTFIAIDFLVREIEEDRFVDSSIYPYLKSPTYAAHPDHNQHPRTPTETWGKSGPLKVQTPTTESILHDEADNQSFKDDLIYSTVNTLREQRMMMVMNELQYAFLYEVIREVFWDKYAAKPEGAVVKAAADAGSGGDWPKGKILKVEGDESDSEAETEIMDKNAALMAGSDDDPYSAVAPEQIREGLAKEM